VIPYWLDSRVDHEAELGLVLGFADPRDEGRKYVDESSARELVAGYTIVNDVTARTLQGTDRDQKYPWLRSKSFDSFCPVGPFVVPVDAIDGNDLEVSITVNGALRQKARTSEMVFGIGKMLAAMARCTTLRCGDLIATGTPEGVGPIVHGDSMAVSIQGLQRIGRTGGLESARHGDAEEGVLHRRDPDLIGPDDQQEHSCEESVHRGSGEAVADGSGRRRAPFRERR
jgi:2-keto-4-pentenoate hydratase/2-oxohepta-3-ene-1,7-dioic acid hydratase in catechol pathway